MMRRRDGVSQYVLAAPGSGKTVVEQVRPVDIALLGVCTPRRLCGWPDGEWLLLDCADGERRTRLARRGHAAAAEDAVADAVAYRSLDLPILDSTGLDPRQVAQAIVDMIDPAFTGSPRSADPAGDEGDRLGSLG